MENAIKYAPRPLPILMYITEAGKMVKINIADQGPGVEEAEREKYLRNFTELVIPLPKRLKEPGWDYI